MNHAITRTRAQEFALILMLGLLNTVTPFSIDLYLPAFPEIARSLHTTVAQVSLSVSTYFLGYSLGQLLYGPLLDRFGRKKPLYVGISVYILATLFCAWGKSLNLLLSVRFLQALAGSVCSVAATAMVRDFFPAGKGSRVFSLMMLILGVSPLLAPTVGGWISSAWGWQAVFYALAVMGVLVLAMCFFALPEGHRADKSVGLSPRNQLHDFKKILKNTLFLKYALAGSFSFAGLFVYVAASPTLFLEYFQVSGRTYGIIFAVLATGMIGGAQVNLWLGKFFTNQQIFKQTLNLQLLTASLFLLSSLFGLAHLIPTLIFLFLLLSCAGITYPNAASIALGPFSENAGRASALLGFMQLGLGSLISSWVGFMAIPGTLATSAVMAGSAAFGFASLRLIKRAS